MSAVPIHVDPARELAEQLREASRGEVVPFLARLTETICQRFKVVHREKGAPWPPATTIEQRQGACRDLAVLWIDICRSVGLAARFVSGYQEGDADQDKRSARLGRSLSARCRLARFRSDATAWRWPTGTWPSPPRPIRSMPPRSRPPTAATTSRPSCTPM